MAHCTGSVCTEGISAGFTSTRKGGGKGEGAKGDEGRKRVGIREKAIAKDDHVLMLVAMRVPSLVRTLEGLDVGGEALVRRALLPDGGSLVVRERDRFDPLHVANTHVAGYLDGRGGAREGGKGASDMNLRKMIRPGRNRSTL